MNSIRVLIVVIVSCMQFIIFKAQDIPLAKFAYNTYSQFGEDGIIEKIFQIIGTQSKICIEFGAWDGFYLSNTAKLWSQEKWHGILIESDAKKFQELVKNTKPYSITCICESVGRGSQSLESLLQKYKISSDSIDLLSIDIDGDDYYILESLSKLRPRVIICEHNPTLPADHDIYFPYGSAWGCSAGALVRLAESKGYKLIAMTDSNCFFVISEEFEKFKEYETRIEKIKITKYLKFLITNYSGSYIILGEWDKTPYGINKPSNDHMCSAMLYAYKKNI